jgi:hypothetical protein
MEQPIMKSYFSVRAAFLSAALLASSIAQSAIVTMMSKKPDAKGASVVYVYNYTCVAGNRGTLNVWSLNDKEAQKQAESQARTICEEL